MTDPIFCQCGWWGLFMLQNIFFFWYMEQVIKMSMRISCLKRTKCKLKEKAIEILKYQIMWSGWWLPGTVRKKINWLTKKMALDWEASCEIFLSSVFFLALLWKWQLGGVIVLQNWVVVIKWERVLLWEASLMHTMLWNALQPQHK